MTTWRGRSDSRTGRPTRRSTQGRAQERLRAAERYGAPLEHFTDPFRRECEGRFSWRHHGSVPSDRLSNYNRRASRLIGAYRTLAAEISFKSRLVRPSRGLTRQSRYEDAINAGDRLAEQFAPGDEPAGDEPAGRLVGVMEDGLDILVFVFDTERGISGAACRLPDLDAVLVARTETARRRNFDLAHELFHILAWEATPPKHVEEAVIPGGGDRVERLANSFAAALLMPSLLMDGFGTWGKSGADTPVARLNRVASEIGVTSSALKWRLITLGKSPAARAREIPESSLRKNGSLKAESTMPWAFSKPFAEVLGMALERGLVSARRAATLVGVSIDELPELLAAHGFEHDIEPRAQASVRSPS